ncbi:MAG: hypothetical protein QXR96_01840 [Candidatus Woesearchaeota archaeon]
MKLKYKKIIFLRKIFSLFILITFFTLIFISTSIKAQSEKNVLENDIDYDEIIFIPKPYDDNFFIENYSNEEINFSFFEFNNNETYIAIYPNLTYSFFKYNDYYKDLFYTGAINKETDNIIYFFDENNNIIKEHPFFENEINVFIFNKYYKKIQLNNNIIEINYCNFNNICENNEEISENNLLCSDCEKSSVDNYCDLDFDNKCDLDCQEYDYDCNCIYCDKNYQAEQEEIFETCEIFLGQICSLNETCTGYFINVSDTDRCCIKGECKVKEDKSKKINSNKFVILILIIFIILILISLILYIINKKKIIAISIIFLLFIISSKNVLSEPVLNKDQIINKVCEITEKYQEKYPICGSFVLGFAETETGLRHWDKQGKVIVSGDMGIGLMQITGNIDNRGYSIKDGHKLNVYNLDDNIEAGILEIISKCKTMNCLNPNSKKEYYCKNYKLLPEKKVIYSGWDLAIRAYNGWGCHASIFRNQWIQKANGNVNIFNQCFEKKQDMYPCLIEANTDLNIFHNGFDPNNPYDGYTPIARRIQNYVDLVNENKKLFLNSCPSDKKYSFCNSNLINENTNNENTNQENEETENKEKINEENKEKNNQIKDYKNLIINKNGYYYLNDFYKIDLDNIDISQIEEEYEFSNILLKEIYDCSFDLIDCNSNKNFECLNEKNEKQTCSENKKIFCKNEKSFRECANEIINKYDHEKNKKDIFLDYCPNQEIEKNCYEKNKIFDGTDCIEKPDEYEKSNILKFCIQTNKYFNYYNTKEKKYELKPINLKFALQINNNKINIENFIFDTEEKIIKDIKENFENEKIENQNSKNENIYNINNNLNNKINIDTKKTETIKKDNIKYKGSYFSIFEQIKNKMKGTLPLYNDCTDDIKQYAWCWVHNGCHGWGIYCKKEKLEIASSNYLAQLFIHELTHNLQKACSSSVESEFGAEYYSGSRYYCFKVNNQWLKADKVAEIMKKNGCSDDMLIETAFCRNKCNNPATEVKGTAYQKC